MRDDETLEVPVATPGAPQVIVIREPGPAHEGGGLKVLEQVVNLVKAVAWPLLVAVFFLVYHDAASEVAREIPKLMANASKVSAGGLAVEIRAQAEQAGGARLSDVVTSLDAPEVERLLKVGCGDWGLFGAGVGARGYWQPKGKDRDLLAALETRHLVSFEVDSKPTTLEAVEARVGRFPDSDANGFHLNSPESRYFALPAEATESDREIVRAQYRLTDLGRSAFNSILAAIVTQLPGKAPASVGCAAGVRE